MLGEEFGSHVLQRGILFEPLRRELEADGGAAAGSSIGMGAEAKTSCNVPVK